MRKKGNDDALPQGLPTTSSHDYQTIPSLDNFLNDFSLIRPKMRKPKVFLKTVENTSASNNDKTLKTSNTLFTILIGQPNTVSMAHSIIYYLDKAPTKNKTCFNPTNETKNWKVGIEVILQRINGIVQPIIFIINETVK